MNNSSPVSAPVQRLISLDVLRGVTIAFMIMVNNNGGSGSWGCMNHAKWNGLTATDLVFPAFVFVVGASIAYAFDARIARGATRAQLARHTVQRAATLFLLGIVVNGFTFFSLAHLRVYGVLQRIALCYLLVGLFYLWDKRISTKVAALVVSLVGYWILLRWVPVPGAGMPGRAGLQPARPRGTAQHPARSGHHIAGTVDRPVAARAQAACHKGAGVGCGDLGLPGHGLPLVHLVSTQ